MFFFLCIHVFIKRMEIGYNNAFDCILWRHFLQYMFRTHTRFGYTELKFHIEIRLSLLLNWTKHVELIINFNI